jgi:lipopolysaccharide export system protein LptA
MNGDHAVKEILSMKERASVKRWVEGAVLGAALLLGVLGGRTLQAQSPGKSPGLSLSDPILGGGAALSGESAKKGLPVLPEKGGRKEAAGAKDSQAVESYTEITAQGGLKFSRDENQAVFVSEVVVSNPDFSLTCDKLTVILRRTGKLAGGESAAPRVVEGEKGGGGIEKAIAEGNVWVSLERWNEKGESERSVGRAQKVIYEADSGDISLIGWPVLEQKGNRMEVPGDKGVIDLNRKGTLVTRDPVKAVFKNPNDGKR